MKFELLANELVLDLFEFLDAIHLLRAFSGLNARFDTLLFTHFHAYQLDFRFVSKSDFHSICQNHLPMIINEVTSLYLSEDETPTLPALFLSYGFTLDRFINLKKLSLYYIQSSDTCKQILIKCRYLLNLTHLNVNIYDSERYKGFYSHMIDMIWSLPKLTHCSLTNIDFRRYFFPEISQHPITSNSIEYLSIADRYNDLDVVSYFLEYTPRLRRFCAYIYEDNDIQLKTMVPILISLNILYTGSSQSLLNLFQKMSNLCHLTVCTYNMYLNGWEWEQIFLKYLTKIKTFRMRMSFDFSNPNNKEEQIDQLLYSFKTHFWLKEHQWLVRCDFTSPECKYKTNILYTLPYAFEKYTYSSELLSKSTCPNDADYWSYDRVSLLGYDDENECTVQKSIQCAPSFRNIRHLVVNIPFNKNFLSYIPSLNQLVSLDVALRNNSARFQLVDLLNHTPRLDSLTLTSSYSVQSLVLQMENLAIRRFSFMIPSQKRSNLGIFQVGFLSCLNIDCIALINSAFRSQFEFLTIGVKCRRTIVDLINAFTNLRLLTAKCPDDAQIYSGTRQINDELIDWLRDNLPSTCSVVRTEPLRDIRIWIHR